MSTYRERTDYFKATHRCVRCGKKDENTESGKTLCSACREYLKVARQKYYESHREQVRQAQRERYDRLKAEGLCVVCEKEKAIEGLTRCDYCRKKNNLKCSQYYYARKVRANG